MSARRRSTRLADDPAGEQECGHAARSTQGRPATKGHRVVVDVVDLPCLGDDEDPVAEQCHRHARPEQREVALAQRCQELHVPYRGSRHARRDRRSRGCRQVDTVARAVARALGFTYLDSGAMYRAVALGGRSRSGASLDIRFEGDRVLLDGEDVTEAIRTPEVSAGGVAAGRRPRRARRVVPEAAARSSPSGDWVAEGRDIGTVVAPDADGQGVAAPPTSTSARGAAASRSTRSASATSATPAASSSPMVAGAPTRSRSTPPGLDHRSRSSARIVDAGRRADGGLTSRHEGRGRRLSERRQVVARQPPHRARARRSSTSARGSRATARRSPCEWNGRPLRR